VYVEQGVIIAEIVQLGIVNRATSSVAEGHGPVKRKEARVIIAASREPWEENE
jgi:hypothetical protein